MNTYTIRQFENAMNCWREHKASCEDAALRPRAGVLADTYSAMIYQRAETVLANTLSLKERGVEPNSEPATAFAVGRITRSVARTSMPSDPLTWSWRT
ncbi:DUF3717 domain-containing protein [uncultured Caballeronia sp.]|uniref:DUF3717 domain-containing protein n=1 Tax=uncultured Caballeronia sp. TaxID=1827198 RepID=UPI0035C9F125